MSQSAFLQKASQKHLIQFCVFPSKFFFVLCFGFVWQIW